MTVLAHQKTGEAKSAMTKVLDAVAKATTG